MVKLPSELPAMAMVLPDWTAQKGTVCIVPDNSDREVAGDDPEYRVASK